ncbi:MAG: PAS domain S-box protein [Terriglobales bacterium]
MLTTAARCVQVGHVGARRPISRSGLVRYWARYRAVCCHQGEAALNRKPKPRKPRPSRPGTGKHTGPPVAPHLAEEALRHSERRFRSMVENSSDIIFLSDDQAVITYASESCQRVLGYTPAELIGRNGFELIHPDDQAATRQNFQEVLQQGHTHAASFRFRHADGSWRYLEGIARNLLADPAVGAIVANMRDITERQIAEEALRESEAKFRAVARIAEKAGSAESLDALYAAIHAILGELMHARNCFFALYDPDTDIVSFPYFVDERGNTPPPRKAGLGLTSYVLRTGQPLLATPETIEDLVRKGEVVRSGPHSLDWLGVPLKKGDHTFGVLGLQSYEERRRYGEREMEILQFVTREVAGAIERRRYLDAVRESEERFRAIAETATSVIVIRSGSRYVYVNRAFEQVTEYTREQALELDPARLVHPDCLELVQTRSQARLRGEPVPSRYEIRIVTRSGKERWLDASATAISYAGQQSILTTAVDITERKRAELLQSALYRIAEQSRSAASLRQFYAAIHAIVGELMDARNFYIALYDPPTQTISFPYFVDEEDVTPPVKLNVGRGLTAYVLRTGQPLLATPEVFDELVRQGEAEEVGAASVDWVGVPLKRGDETFGVLVVQSYTQGIRYREPEKEVLTFVSQQVAGAIERQRSEEALRESESRFRSLVERAVYGICLSSAQGRFLSVNPALVEMLGYASEEEVFALDIARDVYRDPGELRKLLPEVLRTGRMDNLEVQWKRKDGQTITVRLNGRVVPGLQPDNPCLEFIAEDVTAQRSLEAQFRQSQKMEAVGRLAGGVAHDFNNLLTVITGYADIILQQLASDDPLRREMGQINKAAERAALLTRQLLAFSRQQMLEPRVLQINDVVTGIAPMLRRLLGEDIRLITRLHPGLGRIKADPGQMEQVIMNLAVNARDAMPKGGELTIETRETFLDKDFAHDQPTVKPGRYIKLAVTDTGAGMDEETLARVFEPFFTTKERGKGTGLGLSTVYGIVKQSEGYIWAQSKPGKGASFHLYLPAVEIPAAQPGEPETARSAEKSGSETVLVVEDEEGVCSLVRHVLHRQGYNVLEARHAGEALLLCDRYHQTIHLLLTDVILEHVSGPELARRLLAVRPGMKVLFMSGYTDDAVLRHGVQSAETPFLQKPFSTDVLARKVREVLDQPAPAK